MKPRIGLIDHGAGNLVSIAQGLERAGGEVVAVDGPDLPPDLAGLVLPGVGATASVMDGIRRIGLEETLARPPVPLLGICVGMQVLFTTSEEDGAHCLGSIPGRVVRLRRAPRLPHIGWNDVETAEDPIWSGLPSRPLFYFVHSYAPEPDDPGVVIGRSEHGSRFVAAVRRGRVVGVQFHPERSGPAGLRLLANFVAECGAWLDAA
jgi:glutamine amidotransferase